jgi:hypothetical protein
MSRLQTVVWPLLVGSALVLIGLLSHRATSSTPATAASPTPPAASDPAALAALDQAIGLLGSLSSAWVQIELWQKASADDLKFESEGRYLAAPGQRLRCDLEVQVGKSCSQSLTVCDGTTLWQVTRLGNREVSISRITLTNVLELLAQPGTAPELRQEILGDLGFSSVLPLLRILRQRLQGAQQEKTHWQGYDVVCVSGRWPTGASAAAGPEELSGRLLPRRCRLYFDAATSWPYRLEWWGPSRGASGDVLLLQMEFRRPVLNQPLSAERCAVEFAFDPGKTEVSDLTAPVVEGAQRRLRQGRP